MFNGNLKKRNEIWKNGKLLFEILKRSRGEGPLTFKWELIISG